MLAFRILISAPAASHSPHPALPSQCHGACSPALTSSHSPSDGPSSHLTVHTKSAIPDVPRGPDLSSQQPGMSTQLLISTLMSHRHPNLHSLDPIFLPTKPTSPPSSRWQQQPLSSQAKLLGVIPDMSLSLIFCQVNH